MTLTITPNKKEEMLATLHRAVSIVEQLQTVTPCSLCDYDENGFCHKWGERPPEEFRAKGCPEWIEAIPF